MAILPAKLQTWPFVEVLAYKRYFYLEAQSFNDSEGHPEVFIWLWFFGKQLYPNFDQSSCDHKYRRIT